MIKGQVTPGMTVYGLKRNRIIPVKITSLEITETSTVIRLDDEVATKGNGYTSVAKLEDAQNFLSNDPTAVELVDRLLETNDSRLIAGEMVHRDEIAGETIKTKTATKLMDYVVKEQPAFESKADFVAYIKDNDIALQEAIDKINGDYVAKFKTASIHVG